jgi:hypothetical protein
MALRISSRTFRCCGRKRFIDVTCSFHTAVVEFRFAGRCPFPGLFPDRPIDDFQICRTPDSLSGSTSSAEWLSHPRAGLPGSSTDLSARAVSFHPGCPVTALARCIITDGRLPPARQVGRQRFAHEAVALRVRIRYGSRPRFPRLQPTDFAVSRSGRYMSNGQFTWWVPFIPKDQPGLSWRTARQQAV